MGLGVIGVDGKRLVTAGDSRVQLPLVLEHNAKFAMCPGIIGPDGYGHSDAGDGLIELSHSSKHTSKVHMRVEVIGLDSQCPRNETNGNVVSSLLMGDDTKQLQGDRLIGVGLQYPLANALGFSLYQPPQSLTRAKVYTLGFV